MHAPMAVWTLGPGCPCRCRHTAGEHLYTVVEIKDQIACGVPGCPCTKFEHA